MLDRPTKLTMEAIFLATEVSRRTVDADLRGELHKGHRLLRIGKKVWQRADRRKAQVPDWPNKEPYWRENG